LTAAQIDLLIALALSRWILIMRIRCRAEWRGIAGVSDDMNNRILSADGRGRTKEREGVRRGPRIASDQMRAAIYARFSSDEQRPQSIDDQVVTGRRVCDANNWTVVKVYADAAVTGATANRPGYQELLTDLDRGVFDVVVVEALDRLSRNLADVATFHNRLAFRGAKLFAADHGEITGLMVGMLGTMAQAYLDDLKHKTKRGLRGKILAGLSAASRGYGYGIDPNVKGGRRIIEAEAEVVHRIFKMYADGASPRAIAAALNAEGTPGPGGRPWIDTTIRGQVERGTGLLNNPAYVGRLEWNRCTYKRNPATGKPEITYTKVTAGNDSLYVVQKAFKFAPSRDQIVQWMKYLRSVAVCDSRLPDRACPSAKN